MKKRNYIWYGFILVVGDILAINIGFLFSYWIRFHSGLLPVAYGIPSVYQYMHVLPLLTVILLFLMRSDRLYAVKSRLSIVDEFFKIVRSATIGCLLFMAGTFFYREYSFSRGMLFVAWATLILSISVWRLVVNRASFALRARHGTTRNLMVIGNGPMVERLINHVSGDPHWDYNLKGVVRIGKDEKGSVAGVEIVGEVSDLEMFIVQADIDEVILTEIEMPRSVIMHMILECEKRMVEFRLVADLLGMVTSQVDMRTIDGVPLLGLKESPLAGIYNRFIKRTMDIFFSAAGLVAFSPVLLLLAALVKLTSSGPVFYFQKRIGEDGRRFAMIKFRTMIYNAEKGVGPVWASKDDPRRTTVGGVLRKFNFDELPQLINVLKGEMSLVGPRPERPHFVGKFKEDIPRYMARHKIKSGMTGWAQVNGLRGNTSIEERTKYDLYYVENWSLGFDLKILFMTLAKLFNMENAY
jgi:exopolysaccharide biosynthesis polyprenyl glycosylphosphotransferase